MIKRHKTSVSFKDEKQFKYYKDLAKKQGFDNFSSFLRALCKWYDNNVKRNQEIDNLINEN